ncbi:competence protein ComEA [Geosporobacter subterraneus DSM 17957]|uniref:Competence protein ComEA n=2 Tax=Geosporobacter TaxID=390805 RepID=A0A1M6BQ20_9FIRM|nr:competence protein ComEA [Geosporobacter subterraneus DSM 17957]
MKGKGVKRMIRLTKREYITMSILMASMIIFMVGQHILLRPEKPTIELQTDSTPMKADSIEIKEEIPKLPDEQFIVIDICGAVQYAGVVKLKQGDRMIDAVEAAGGLLSTADRKQVNLARILVDGEQIYIPEVGEVENVNSGIGVSMTTSTQSGKININTASQSELETLNGIGKVLAERILQYRNDKGRFKTIEEIKKVSGIGDKKYEGIKDHITVN